MLIALGLVLIVALTVATGYFVAQEFAYVTVDRARLAQLAAGGDRAAGRALQVTRRLSFTLSGAQFGITVTALLAGYVAEPFLGAGLAPLLHAAGLPQEASTPVAFTLALIVATVVQMVLGELAPKNLGIARPVPLARALAGSTLVWLAMAGPVIRVFDTAANRLLRWVGIEPVEELPQGATPEELERIIEESQARGRLDPQLSRLLDRALDFRHLTAEQVMVPRVEVHVVRAADPVRRVVELLATGHARFPVIGDDLDDVVGVAGAHDVLTVPAEARDRVPVADVAHPPLLVPATLPLPRLLEELRRAHRQLACVVDEYGGLAGVVTLEDVVEELVGEIFDEDDTAAPAATRTADGSWIVPATWRLDQVHDVTGVELPASDDYDTLSGLLMARLGRIPAVGDHLDLTVPRHDDHAPATGQRVRLVVETIHRRVPAVIRIHALDTPREAR
ncbi:membrane protein [Carbonactinospora thermoautotrophica]|uniref:Membrane protein n=1 Tax=Carbonactinospora thermoautotrophica TaxID=1469144 RepID=A0A132NDL3_9ACTN|nr:hemolysin family protein [Carbonactinospora thermoautotrophica]KWX05906.1 membrane protein [Carbonactinospora thermoautotrophica]KWX08239.1 membrane protein [Carbonactinospora thermoautotrophica]